MASIQISFLFSFHFNYIYLWALRLFTAEIYLPGVQVFPSHCSHSFFERITKTKESHTTKSVTWRRCVSSRSEQRTSPAGTPSSLAGTRHCPGLQPQPELGTCGLGVPSWLRQGLGAATATHPLGIQGWSGQESCARGRGVHKMLHWWI